LQELTVKDYAPIKRSIQGFIERTVVAAPSRKEKVRKPEVSQEGRSIADVQDATSAEGAVSVA
jgi:hypothetical protein